MAAKAHACPFCRSHDLDATGWKVECLSCGAAGPLGHSAADAVELWNERFTNGCLHAWGTESIPENPTLHRAVCVNCGQHPATGGAIKPGPLNLVGSN